eukprot:m.1041599 g.1041599  ORF g.1041599 m.1041599 type:complete len:574 (+) comp24159_c0_seq26:129-1850(+)
MHTSLVAGRALYYVYHSIGSVWLVSRPRTLVASARKVAHRSGATRILDWRIPGVYSSKVNMTETSSGATIADRKAAQEYVDASGLVPSIEQAINDGCRKKPRDLAGFVARHLFTHACNAPTIEHVETFDDGLGDDGCRAIVAKVKCFHHGTTEICGRAKISYGCPQESENQDAPDTKLDDNHANDTDCGYQISAKLQQLDPCDTQNVEKTLEEILETNARTSRDKKKILAASLALLSAASRVTETPVYQYIRDKILPASLSQQLRTWVPAPVITAFLPALSGGKVKVRGVWIAPPILGTSSVSVDVAFLADTYRALSALAGKSMPAAGNTAGAGGLVPPKMDKIEQMLDMIREAATQAGATKEAPARILLDIHAHSLWNEGKAKYELVAGAQKAPSDYVKDLSALAKSRPEIVGFCDPLIPEHAAEWRDALLSQLPKGCIVFESKTGAGTDKLPHCRNDSDVENSVDPNVSASTTEEPPALTGELGVCITAMHCATLGHIIRAAETTKEPAGESIPLCYSAVDEHRLCASEAADIAMSLGARFVQVGSTSGAGAALCERLVEVQGLCTGLATV